MELAPILRETDSHYSGNDEASMKRRRLIVLKPRRCAAPSDLEKKNGPVGPPIYQTSTFEVTDNEEQCASRPPTATTRAGETRQSRWPRRPWRRSKERTPRVTFASGMGAITTTILALLKAEITSSRSAISMAGRHKFLSQWLPKLGMETTFVDTTDYEQHARAIRPNTKLLYLESPTNPDDPHGGHERGLPTLAKQHGLISMVDSTFGTPINQRPAEYGIDLVMHSGTKYLSGTCGPDLRSGRRDARN